MAPLLLSESGNLQAHRILRRDAHDDGVNRWSMIRVAAPASIAGIVHGYCAYSERTHGFTTRRELPHAQGVLLMNLGSDIFIRGADGGEITVTAGQAFLAGAHLRPALSRSTGAQAGIRIELPLEGLRRLTGVPMTALRDRVVPLDELIGEEARALGQRLGEARGVEESTALLDAALALRLAGTRPLDTRETGALELLRLRPDLDIADVAREVGWSRKHLADRVRDAVGVGPRSFRRLLRFGRLIERLNRYREPGGTRDWAQFALLAGYCDQSHLIRDFSEFAAMTPTEFNRRSLPDGGGLVEN